MQLELPDPTARYRRSWAEHLQVPPRIDLDKWADGRLILPREMSPEPGVMRLSRTPYLREIMAATDDPAVEEVVWQCGTQLGKSTLLLARLAKVIGHEPAPVMFIQPTEKLAKRFSRQRVAPLISANAFLRNAVSEVRSRDSANTVLLKEFTGGILAMTGANSPAELASMPAKELLGDEIDDYPDDVGGQGDPLGLVIPRQDSFGCRARRIFVSSPKKPKGVAGIEERRKAGTDEHYEVPCPTCGEYQRLEWGGPDKPYGIKWHSKDGRPLLATVVYCCRHCAAEIPESAKRQMLEAGRWVQKNPGSKTRSFHLSSLYSPLGWLSWRAMVQEFVRASAAAARGNFEKLKAFVNTRLAETWEEQGSTLDAAKLKEKAEDFRLRYVPSLALVLLAAVDVQDDRFEIDVYAIGPRGAMWTVDTIVIPGNPALEEDWAKVDAVLLQRYEHEDGFELGIEAVAVDTGGHHTHEAYNFVRTRDPRRNVFAIKGADKPGQQLLSKPSLVDVNLNNGQVLKGGVKLWHIGVGAAKDRLFGLMRADPKKGMFHASSDLEDEYFDQITAEHKVQQKTGRGTRWVWVKRKGHNRNERLDCAVYVIWLVEKMRVTTWPPRLWDALRKRLDEQMHTRLAAAAVAEQPAAWRKPDEVGKARSSPQPASHIDDTPDDWF